jgi:ABC-type nitrate/sulfonate/bicarbonate transport system permease component
VFLGVLIFSVFGLMLMEALKVAERKLAPWRKTVQEI